MILPRDRGVRSRVRDASAQLAIVPTCNRKRRCDAPIDFIKVHGVEAIFEAPVLRLAPVHRLFVLASLIRVARLERLSHPPQYLLIEIKLVEQKLYTGLFQWNGKLHHGKHEPLVSIALWERVQGALTGRHATQGICVHRLDDMRRMRRAVVAEIKKGKYVYYHCTGHADKGRGGYADCRRKYVRDQVLDETFVAGCAGSNVLCSPAPDCRSLGR